jgi:hypothetical protein
MYLQNVISRKNCVKNYFFAGILKVMTKTAGSGSIIQRHGSADPDPPQNVMDPQHCPKDMDFSPRKRNKGIVRPFDLQGHVLP